MSAGFWRPLIKLARRPVRIGTDVVRVGGVVHKLAFDVADLDGWVWALVTTSPGGAKQWVAKTDDEIIPDACDAARKHRPTMLTTDLSLRVDPAYEKISRRFLEHPDEFALAFAKAGTKLPHRDMGPVSRFLGRGSPSPSCDRTRCPAVEGDLVGDAAIAALKAKVLDAPWRAGSARCMP